MKICPACKEAKPGTRDFFYADKRTPDGLAHACKICHLQRTARYGRDHPRDRHDYNAAWFAANRDQVRVRATPAFAQWRKENRIKRMEWEANYRRTETYRKANVIHQANRRARQNNAPGTHTVAEFQAVLIGQSYRCFYCGCDISNGATEDHFIPLTKGGSNYIDNIRAACRPCNVKKGNRPSSKMGGSN
jgi:5-methylcytosine-specific restriction endonuclease McrA